MALANPTLAELRSIAQQYNFTHMQDGELEVLSTLVNALLDSQRRLDEIDDPNAVPVPDRDAGQPPTPEENPFNAWSWRASIEGSGEGILAGKRIAIKDNVAVAGLPMKIGTSLLEGFIAPEDATMVSRLLAAGATITGKAACENMSFSGSSFTGEYEAGPVLNPHDPARTSGGSSSGSGALVASGACDIATGGDQAGSTRIPSSFCGVYGLKPTYGLLTTTGAAPIDLTADHVGPMAATVADVALFLDAVAGVDPLDPRQRGSRTGAQLPNYTSALTGDVRGLRIGIVDEGFDWPVSEEDVDAAVREAAQAFQKLGADVRRTSLPLHRDGVHMNASILVEGAFNTMFRGNLAGTNWKGRYPLALMEAFGAAKRERADEMGVVAKVLTLAGEYLQEKYHGRYYGKAQNLGIALTEAYDRAFKEFDILVMPTTPMKATLLPTDDMSQVDRFNLLLNMIPNTGPGCVTGHPALSVPCARSNGLPVGMMLLGRHWEDDTLLRAAHAYEATGLYGDVLARQGANA